MYFTEKMPFFSQINLLEGSELLTIFRPKKPNFVDFVKNDGFLLCTLHKYQLFSLFFQPTMSPFFAHLWLKLIQKCTVFVHFLD